MGKKKRYLFNSKKIGSKFKNKFTSLQKKGQEIFEKVESIISEPIMVEEAKAAEPTSLKPKIEESPLLETKVAVKPPRVNVPTPSKPPVKRKAAKKVAKRKPTTTKSRKTRRTSTTKKAV
tara:strand:- start:77 stop:436 length:360 start_codon:yes stop_codon:yes gene_type:complete